MRRGYHYYSYLGGYMLGVTKHIYDHDIRNVISMWNTQLQSIQELLPKNYTENDIVSMLKYFYPHEWSSVAIKYWYYKKRIDI